jgi:hypothetical protein
LTDVANELHHQGALDEEECVIDATFVMATEEAWKSWRFRTHGLPPALTTHAGDHHEVRLVQLCLVYMIEAKVENLIGDRAYDSGQLDEELRRDGSRWLLRTVPIEASRPLKIADG